MTEERQERSFGRRSFGKPHDDKKRRARAETNTNLLYLVHFGFIWLERKRKEGVCFGCFDFLIF